MSIENRSTKKLASMVLLSVEFLQKAKATKNPLNTDEMAQQFAMKHIEQPVQLHQRVNSYSQLSNFCLNCTKKTQD